MDLTTDDLMRGDYVIFQCHCTYVHEFQHGMKLAGELQKIKI